MSSVYRNIVATCFLIELNNSKIMCKEISDFFEVIFSLLFKIYPYPALMRAVFFSIFDGKHHWDFRHYWQQIDMENVISRMLRHTGFGIRGLWIMHISWNSTYIRTNWFDIWADGCNNSTGELINIFIGLVCNIFQENW